MLAGFLVHAGAVVCDGHHDAGAGSGAAGSAGLADLKVGGCDLKAAAVRHGVARIDEQVHDHLLDLFGIGQDTAQMGIERGGEGDVFADEAAEHAFGIADGGIEVERTGLDDLLAAEGEELAGEGGCAFAGLADFLGAVPQGAVGIEAAGEEIGIAIDDGEQVIEIVSDTAGEASDAFQFLRLAELLLQFLAGGFGLFALGDVADGGDDAGGAIEFERVGVDLHGNAAAIAGDESGFAHGVGPGQKPADNGESGGVVFGSVDIAHAHEKQFLAGVAQQAAGVAVGFQKAAGQAVGF